MIINQRQNSQNHMQQQSDKISKHSSARQASNKSKSIKIDEDHASIKYLIQQPRIQTEGYPQYQWQAAYIDGKYYLSDPHSLAKLRELENQIQAQRQKLTSIQQTQKFNNSFLSHQHPNNDHTNFDVLTEVNESRLYERQQNAEADLVDEENRYKNKIDQMKKKRSEIKKKMGVTMNEKNIQTNEQSIKMEQQKITVTPQKQQNNAKIVSAKSVKNSQKHQNEFQKPSQKEQSVRRSSRKDEVTKKEESQKQVSHSEKHSVHNKIQQINVMNSSDKPEQVREKSHKSISKSIRISKQSSQKDNSQKLQDKKLMSEKISLKKADVEKIIQKQMPQSKKSQKNIPLQQTVQDKIIDQNCRVSNKIQGQNKSVKQQNNSLKSSHKNIEEEDKKSNGKMFEKKSDQGPENLELNQSQGQQLQSKSQKSYHRSRKSSDKKSNPQLKQENQENKADHSVKISMSQNNAENLSPTKSVGQNSEKKQKSENEKSKRSNHHSRRSSDKKSNQQIENKAHNIEQHKVKISQKASKKCSENISGKEHKQSEQNMIQKSKNGKSQRSNHSDKKPSQQMDNQVQENRVQFKPEIASQKDAESHSQKGHIQSDKHSYKQKSDKVQQSEHLSRKSSDKISSKQKGKIKDLNLPEPSHKSSRVHAPFNDVHEEKSVEGIRVHVNYIRSECSDSRSCVNNQDKNKGKAIHETSDYKSQKGSHIKSENINHPKQQRQKQSQKNSRRSRSKRSEIIDHIDKSQEQVEKTFKNKHQDECLQKSKISQSQNHNHENFSQDKSITNKQVSKFTQQNPSESYEQSQSRQQDSQFDQSQQQISQSKQSKIQSSMIDNSETVKKYQIQQAQDPSRISPSAFRKQKLKDQLLQENKHPQKQKSSRKSQKSKHNKNQLPVTIIDAKKQSMNHSQNKSKAPSKISQIEVQLQNDEKIKNKSHSKRSQKSQKKQIKISQNQELSQKKPKSFIIHSRQNSVKSKKSNKRDHASSSKNQQYYHSNIASESQIRNRHQIDRLNNQIKILHQKLQNVEQKQQTMIKFENNQSNLMMNEDIASQVDSSNEAVSPLRKTTFTSRLKLQKKLSFAGSTVQFNTFQEKKRLNAQENEKAQKYKLQQEVGRLRKIIRDMQMEKIKSIDSNPLMTTSRFQQERKPIVFDDFQNKSKPDDKWKQSLNSELLQTRKKLQTQIEANNGNGDIGKIVKNNSPNKSTVITYPRQLNKDNAQRVKQVSQNKDYQQYQQYNEQQAPLPLKKRYLSSADRQLQKKEHFTKQELFNKFEQNEKDFHNFLESSRMINEPESQIQMSLVNQTQSKFPLNEISSPQQFQSDIAASGGKKNFSEIIQKIKKQNPEDDEILVSKQIEIGNLEFPELPEPPNVQMSQNELIQLAKKTYALFGIKVDQSDYNNQLQMKKYKNCIVFSLSSNNSECILWHYSGKFYMGGWKNNDASQGEKTGAGLEYIPGKHVYKGQFLGGKKNGTGIMKLDNGNVFEGQWVDGVKNGRGVYYEENTKTFYSGEWKDGKRDGYGLLKFTESQFYQGTFQKSIKHGYGVEKFANSDIYKGQYQKGRFFGKGKYMWSNGSSYEGSFIDGSRQGQGCWKSSRNGGDIYIGMYENDKKSGYGRYVWANGCVYEGYFKNDLKNGKGRLIYQDGKQIKGTWEDGNLVNSDGQSRRLPNHEEQPLRKSIRISSLRQSSQPNRFRGSYV